MKRLENRVAIVTGGTAGIGEATALRFAREGAQVVVWARNEARGKEMEKKAAAEGLAITFDKVDTSDFEAVTAAAKRVADKFGKIDILINNAGITNDSTLKKMTVEQWQNVIDVNLSGTFYCCKAVLNYMLEAGYGRIVNASSVVGLYGNFGQTNYVATKAGLIGMTKTMARELGRKGITVNAVAPGLHRNRNGCQDARERTRRHAGQSSRRSPGSSRGDRRRLSLPRIRRSGLRQWCRFERRWRYDCLKSLKNHTYKMNFELTKTEQLFRQMIREFAENEVKPLAAEIDEEERFPVETVEKMAKLGIFGIPFPVNYGGAGGNNILYSMAVEELSRVCATTGVVVSAHTSLCAAPIYEHGTEEQKMKYLPKLCSGEWLGAFGLTEPNAGTDAAAQQTTAVDAGDHYILNGNKIFITNAAYAHVYIVMAMTDKSQGTRGISAFIVERDFPGFSIGKKEKKMGIRGSATCELIFENCIVPKENLLGKVGKGFSIAMKTLDGGRVGIASQALGIAQGAMDETVKYVKERKQFGRTIGQFQNTQFQLADLDTKIEAARLLVRAAAFKKDQKLPFSVDAARAKLFAAETAMEVTTKAVQFHGGYGYTREYPVERMMRDAKITEIYEGTSEVQRMVISSALLK